jgi:tRNA nucleotidyltransferase (CCA-adding enzyme)
MRAETVIATHANTDFDALASMLAVRRLYPGSVVALPGALILKLGFVFVFYAV